MIRGFLAGLGVALLAIVATVIRYEGISLPFIGQIVDGEIAGRLEGYVALSEKTAADAKAAEAKRQADAARAATDAARKREQDAKAAQILAEADLEKGIASYEQRLAEAKRRCDLDADDVDFILRHR